jgi:outer membrane protein assembly factor BamB
MKKIIILAALTMLSSCGQIHEFISGDSAKPKLEGKRVEIFKEYPDLIADVNISDVVVTMPDVRKNENWRQASGSPSGITGNLAIGSLTKHESIKIGDSNICKQPLYSAPIIAEGVIFAMDSKGYISSNNANDLSTKWLNKTGVDENESEILGGGLAFDEGVVYATTGRGEVFAIDAKTGNKVWFKALGVPLRAAPKVLAGKIYAVSVDNQLFAFDAKSGMQIWNSRGINENSGFMATISPAITENIVIAPYSSGEIHALDANSGQDLWNDSLNKVNYTAATAKFSGIGGNPIIKDDIVYVASNNGYFVAFAIANGRRLWQQEISSLNSAWIGDDFIYILSIDNKLVCLQKSDGRIKWVKQIPSFEDAEKKKNPYIWHGPVLADSNILIAGEHGKMLMLSAKNGNQINELEIADNIKTSPIIANGSLYLLDKNAKLHQYK